MADKLESLRKRRPWDEIDPETGAPLEDIPGVTYPAEFQAAEDLGIAAATGGSSFGPKAILRAAGKKAVGQAEASALDAVNRKLAGMKAQEAAAIRNNPEKMRQLVQEHMKVEAPAKPEYRPNISEGSPLDYGAKQPPAADRTAPRKIQEMQKVAKVVDTTPSGTPVLQDTPMPPQKVKFPEYQGQTHQEKMAIQRKEGGNAVMDWLKSKTEGEK